MSPIVSNNTNASSNAVQPLRAAEQRARSERSTASGVASSRADATATPSAVVTINPAARERAQADRASGATTSPNNNLTDGSADSRVAARASRPSGARVSASAAANGNRVPTNVSAALRAYGSTQAATTAVTPTRTTGSQVTQESRSTTASNDPTGATQVGRTKPARASTQETADSAEKAQVRQQRDQAANLQSAATATTRLANQSARIG